MLQKLGLDEATSRNDILVPIRLVADFEAASRVAIHPAMWLSYIICFAYQICGHKMMDHCTHVPSRDKDATVSRVSMVF